MIFVLVCKNKQILLLQNALQARLFCLTHVLFLLLILFFPLKDSEFSLAPQVPVLKNCSVRSYYNKKILRIELKNLCTPKKIIHIHYQQFVHFRISLFFLVSFVSRLSNQSLVK